jgi:cold shock CspA family protein
MRGRDVRELKRRTHDVAPSAITRRGVVKMFRVDKNYGFLQAEDGREIFFHISTVTGPMPMANDPVQYTSDVRDGRPRAASVKVTRS